MREHLILRNIVLFIMVKKKNTDIIHSNLIESVKKVTYCYVVALSHSQCVIENI